MSLPALHRFFAASTLFAALLAARAAHGEEAPAATAATATPRPTPHRVFAEVDPLPFVLGGYGGQVGYRPAPLPRLRVAIASFSLKVPDALAQIGKGNGGFHVRVLPSAALYALYYLSDARGGFLLGGALRYLRMRYTHDDFAGQSVTAGEFSIEAIAGYKWHPFAVGFYLQPWVGLSGVLTRTSDPNIGDRAYSPLPVQPFGTVNVGWELAL